jgi:phosphomevalonate kinase
MPSKASFFAPGKLYIAGEYAVTAPTGEAIIFPVKKGIQVTVVSRKKSRIINRQYPKESLAFTWISDIANPYLRLAIEVVRQFIGLKNISWRNFTLTIDSTLVSQHGKYGLGSSGALTVAVIGALLKFFGIASNPEMIYRLAVIATVHNYQDTSFGDVACSSAKMPIRYRKFDEAMLPIIKTMSVQTLLTMPWEGLLIESLPKFGLKPMVIYSGTSASSHQLVKCVKPFITLTWVTRSNALVHELKTQQKINTIQALHRHLSDLHQVSKCGLTTPNIRTIIKMAKDHGGAAKFSGAGGGDSVIVYIPQDHQKNFITAIKKTKYRLLRDII